jgi:predicted Zn finger-like uncharacterized protein
MFTQCPDCQTTFRVSADVLQQADGRVRCGGCGIAFSALDHLSKDDANTDAAGDETSKESTSDQNKQLLETLDQLAGPEVEIEDTGVEWRVIEKPSEQEDDPASTGSMNFVVEGDEDAPDSPAVHGRQSDLPQQTPDGQEFLDLPETEQPQARPSERRYDDNTVLPDDFGDEADLDELPFLDAGTPKRRASDREIAKDTTEFDEAQVDLALGEPEEWVDLLDEVDEEADAAKDDSAEDESEAEEEEEPETIVDEADDEPPAEDMPSDINTQFLLQAEEMGIDTGNHPVIEDEGDDDANEVAEDDEDEPELGLEEDAEPEEDEGDKPADDEVDDPDLESTGEFEEQIEVAKEALTGDDEEDDQSDISDKEIEELAELDIEKELTASDSKDEGATEESDGSEDALATAIRSGKDVSKLFDEDSPMVETIIMEGDLVGDSINQKRQKFKPAADSFENPGPLEDTYSLSRGKVRGGRRAGDPAGPAVMTGVAILALLLIAQIMHQSRQTLATYGAFNQTIGSIYRAIGKPVTPEWNIRGWRFEATNGNVDEEENLLTIYSRMANKSSQALPYPLVHISLTDRWEDVIGSRVLEPNEYLAGDLDPRKPVPPDENFTAVITIESPSADATGFRLTACYRISAGRVRCADEHFKD